MTKCVSIVVNGPEITSHWAWLLHLFLTLEAIFFAAYAALMLLIQTVLISFGCLQWDFAKVLRLKAFFAQRARQSPSSADRNPGLCALLMSTYACQFNRGFLQNWLDFFSAKPPHHCLHADPNHPNLDHGLPRLASDGSPVRTRRNRRPTRPEGRPAWMVFLPNAEDPEEIELGKSATEGKRTVDLTIPSHLNEVI
eukprot:CAMPEP_0167772610 /NCGR_PEP_ID=MMETSP0111_2-20121227/943_1 /TAXON_ID=91324 /ORGANISM="Lotharella globosa, Strain CCCM811" /LENGTH=195 /DNA_ID=CAMNT_0007662121 /DNA_START=543 /DNA_END=1130 /DNA_ORIENTATION=-